MDAEPNDLIERASRGEALAVDELIERHLPGLTAYVSANLGPLVGAKESASDLVQSACREVLAHIGRFRYEGEDGFKRWLYATALRKIQDRHRYFRAGKRDAGREAIPRSGSELAGDLLRDSSTPSRALAQRDEVARIESVLDTLPENYGRVIRMAYLEELSREEIAERLEISAANARMLLSRAIARLARRLEEG